MIKLKDILLNEQEDFGAKSYLGPKPGYHSSSSDFIAAHTKWFNDTVKLAEDPHFWEMMGFAFVFVPLIGIPLSMAAELNAARLYHTQGDDFNAGVTGVLALLPLVGKIPGVKQVTSSFIKAIKNKIISGAKLTGDQIKYINSLLKNSKFINNKLLEIKKLIYGIDKVARDKAKRMLEQKLKMAGENVDEITKVYQEYIDGFRKIGYKKGYGKAGKLGTASGFSTRVFSDAISKGVKLNKKQIRYIVSHEMDHLYNNTAKEALDWVKAFDPSKWTSKTQSYFGTFRMGIYKKAGAETTTKGFNLGGKYRSWDELRARAAQLKDFIALKRRIPLKQDFKIIMPDLDYALENFVKETGLDNSMTKFINGISDKQHLLKLMNKYALGTAGVATLKSAWDYGYEDDTNTFSSGPSLPNYNMDSAPPSVKNLPRQ